MLLIPKAGSFVVIVMMRQNSGYIALYSDVDSIKMLDGTFGGLIKINDLVSRLVEYEDLFDHYKRIAINVQFFMDFVEEVK